MLNFPAGTGYAWATIEQVMLGGLHRLAQRGWSGAVCRPARSPDTADPFLEAGVPTLEFDYAATSRSIRRTLAFCRLLRRERVGVLYLTDQPTWSSRYLLFRLLGRVRRIVVHDRTSGERSLRPLPVRATKRLAHRLLPFTADQFVGVSDFVVRRLRSVNGTPPERTVRIYNGIDLSRFDGRTGESLHRLLGIPASTPVVFACGRAMPYKGVPVLLWAAHELHKSHPDVHFVYAGDGPRLEQFREDAKTLGLTQFHFLGKRADTADLLRSATIAAVPSVWAEAFGLTVVEAMAAGIPVVASEIGGIPELIEPGETGLLVSPNAPVALANAIRALLADPSLRARLGAGGREAARVRFSLERVADDIANLIGGLGR